MTLYHIHHVYYIIYIIRGYDMYIYNICIIHDIYYIMYTYDFLYNVYEKLIKIEIPPRNVQ